MKINKNNIALLINILIVVSTVTTRHFVKFVSWYLPTQNVTKYKIAIIIGFYTNTQLFVF